MTTPGAPSTRDQLRAEVSSRDATIQDLVAKLDAANREIGATHQLAAGYARDLSESRERLAQTMADLASTRTELAATDERLRATETARAAPAGSGVAACRSSSSPSSAARSRRCP